jgi:uncharacterized repeat protein (TIGR03803 family)
MLGKLNLSIVLCAPIVLPAQTFSTLVNFSGANGADPDLVTLVQGFDGSLYGTTTAGGQTGNYSGHSGIIFKTSASGVTTVFYNFCHEIFCPDGASSAAGLILATDGNLYGTTTEGGAYCHPNGCGTVFKITQDGALTTLYSFCAQPGCADGASPQGGLIQATDGNFYGTTTSGGPTNNGTIFKLTSDGVLTILHGFTGSDGATPISGVLQAVDGALYGTTIGGGSNSCFPNGCGTVFQIDPTGRLERLETLHNFHSTDGANPYGGLVQAANGTFYGTTAAGGAFISCNGACGTVFQITPEGELTTPHEFCTLANCADGGVPQGGLIQATDGNLYGTARAGGSSCNCGTVFEITLAGTLTTLHRFGNTDGYWPFGALLQGTDGNLYGTTSEGGQVGVGTVFKLSLELGPFVKTVPTSGVRETPVIILGTNLTGATSVKFNGSAATFNVVSDTEITTVVPGDATSGAIEVATPSGTLRSKPIFNIRRPLILRRP